MGKLLKIPQEEILKTEGGNLLASYNYLRRLVVRLNNNLATLYTLNIEPSLDMLLEFSELYFYEVKEKYIESVIWKRVKLFEKGEESSIGYLDSKGRIKIGEYSNNKIVRKDAALFTEIKLPTHPSRWNKNNALQMAILETIKKEKGSVTRKDIAYFLMERKYHRWLSYRFREIVNPFTCNWEVLTKGEVCNILLYRELLVFTKDKSLIIDVPLFVKKYRAYTEGELKEGYERHEAAAESINRFFNGAPITRENFWEFFILEYGFIKPNPLSVNAEKYSYII